MDTMRLAFLNTPARSAPLCASSGSSSLPPNKDALSSIKLPVLTKDLLYNNLMKRSSSISGPSTHRPPAQGRSYSDASLDRCTGNHPQQTNLVKSLPSKAHFVHRSQEDLSTLRDQRVNSTESSAGNSPVSQPFHDGRVTLEMAMYEQPRRNQAGDGGKTPVGSMLGDCSPSHSRPRTLSSGSADVLIQPTKASTFTMISAISAPPLPPQMSRDEDMESSPRSRAHSDSVSSTISSNTESLSLLLHVAELQEEQEAQTKAQEPSSGGMSISNYASDRYRPHQAAVAHEAQARYAQYRVAQQQSLDHYRRLPSRSMSYGQSKVDEALIPRHISHYAPYPQFGRGRSTTYPGMTRDQQREGLAPSRSPPGTMSAERKLQLHELRMQEFRRVHGGPAFVAPLPASQAPRSNAARSNEPASDRPFACPGCDKTFARRYDRNRHARKHTGEKPYQCTAPNCGEEFGRPDALQRHYRARPECAEHKESRPGSQGSESPHVSSCDEA